jgi:hypothetical protein
MKKERGEFVSFLLLLPIWLLAIGIFANEIGYINHRNDAVDDARIALRTGIREEAGYILVEDYLIEEGYDSESITITIYEVDHQTDVNPPSALPMTTANWTKGNMVELEFRSQSNFVSNVVNLCWLDGFQSGESGVCTPLWRHSSPIKYRMMIEK